MSLARQIVTLLDLATGPLSVPTLVAQIAALGGDAGADAVHKRMHQMQNAGQAKKDGAGWVLVDGLPLQNLRAKWARDDEPAPVITAPLPVAHKPPTLRDRIVQALREHPGMTAKELGAHLGDLAGNEPASTLNILGKAKRVRHEGEWPGRRYYACDDSERLVLPRAKRKKSGAESGLAKPAQAVADPEPAGAQHLPIADVERLLELHGTWCMPAFVAAAMELDRAVVVEVLEQLVANGRAVSRFVSALERAKQYAHISAAAQPTALQELEDTARSPHPPSRHCMCAECAPSFEPTPSADEPAGSVHTGPLTDTHGPIASEGLRELAARDALVHAAQGASTALHEAAKVIEELAEEVDELDKVIGANPATLPGYARCIALDLEDAIGRACDQRADYGAIKALSVALGSTWRAITQLSPAPPRATHGVPQS
jgi:hypothetical protein